MFKGKFTNRANIRVFSKKRTHADDPFVFVKNLFLDGGYNIITKNINYLCLVFHTSCYLLDMYYFINYFTIDLLLKYACGIANTIYVSTTKNIYN